MLPPHLTHRQKPRTPRKLKRVPFFRLLGATTASVVRLDAHRLAIKPQMPELKARLRVLTR